MRVTPVLLRKWHLSNEEGPDSRGFETVYHKQTYTGIKSAAETRIPDCSEWKYYEQPLCTEDTSRGEGEIVRPGYPRYSLYGTSETPFDDEPGCPCSRKAYRGGSDRR